MLDLAEGAGYSPALATSVQQEGEEGARTDMTRRRVVALDQSLLSSRQRMMYSGCIIFCCTMVST